MPGSCDDHDKFMGDILDGISCLGDKMDSVVDKVHQFEVQLGRQEVRLEEHIRNALIHVSKWWALPAAVVVALAAIAGLIK